MPPTNRTPCPRCSAPVTGDFKFCPTCAYRLRASEAGPVETEERGGRRWSNVFLGLLLGVLVAAIAAVGMNLFSTPDRPLPNGSDEVADVSLTVANVLRLMVGLSSGDAMDWPSNDPTAGGSKPVRVGASFVLPYEVTRGMYAEFLTSCDADPSKVPWELQFIWRPVPSGDAAVDAERLRASNTYIDLWWEAARAQLEEVGGAELERPEAPLPPEYGNLLMVPPSWVYVTPFDEFRWRVPEGTEDLPVTEVSWYDAVAFAAWVRAEYEIECRLPADMEWVRAGNGGNLEENRKYPWGEDPNVYACNSSSFWGDSDKPQLLPVHYRYSEEDYGRTQEGEGLWAMSGNAAEWTLPSDKVDRNGYMGIEFAPSSQQETFAPVLGGSFRDGIQDCTVEFTSAQFLDKMGRWDNVGFRLWMPGHPLGG